MRNLVMICLAMIPATILLGSAESENEPGKGQMDVIARAVTSLSQVSIPEIRSRFNKDENTGYYLRDISFLGRYPTKVGVRLLFRTTFIRSSPYRADAITPPRGHTFVIAFDDQFTVLGYQRTEADSTVTVTEGTVRSDEALLFNFNTTKQ